MEYIKFLKSKKILLLAIGVVIVAGVTGFIFYEQRLPTYKLSIVPTKLLPFVSHQQARATICNTMKGQLFDEICQKQFDGVGKNDAEKIGALFLVLKKIENDRGISDYERLLLTQAVFASLPTKDSPLTQRPGFSALFAALPNFIGGENIAYAKESNDTLGMGEGEFLKMMLADLKQAVSNLPKGDNAWVINVAVSKYGWINGRRQPIYSEGYVASYDPYPGVATEPRDRSKTEYHIQSRVGSRATSQEMYSGSLQEGSGEMTGYSFSMESFYSPPYGRDSVLILAEAGPSEYDYANRHHFTEENYKGDDLLSDLLANVKMPVRQQAKKAPEDKAKPSNQITHTAWGSADEWETAYEAYFWMHLQSPDRVHNFWAIYLHDEETPGKALRGLPLGEIVDLQAYFNTPGVKEHYEFTRKNGVNIPPLNEFLNTIAAYQANLGLGKPAEEEAVEEVKPDEVSPGELEYRRWLDCAGRPGC